MVTTGNRTVLVTGASGVVGRAVVEQLARHRVIGLVHADTEPPPADEVLVSDLAQPRLGLTERRWRELADEVDVIVHSGALTSWGQPRERYQAINIDGTARVIELARLAAAPVHLISTCFVHAIERGALAELSADNVVRPYLWSKLESERLLAASGLPHSVFRPTNLVGDSVTGASSRPQIVQAMSDWVCRGKAPYFPAHHGNLVDVAPLDVLAVAVARAVDLDDVGRTYWVSYGEQALSVEQAMAILVAHARDRGRPIPPVPVADPRHGLPVPLDRVPATSRAFVKVLIDVSEVIHASGGVLPTSLPELQRRLGVPAVSAADAYRRSLDYWARQRAAELPATTKEVS